MTIADITELERLLEAATPGPLSSHDTCCKQIYEGDWCVATTLSVENEDYTCGEGRTQEAAQDLKRLIVASVNSLPALLRLARVALEIGRQLDDLRDVMPGAANWADRITQAAKEDK